ncbi:MAG TPA: DUF1648 domain-containing protein [Candidatus Angelobacter sp.]|nr:DUF1648 domain-containing protein [Candidatus Angelobacter sp.]
MKARLALPVIWSLTGALLLKLFVSWNRLPERVAVHFNIRMEPNGWSSRGDLAAIVLLAVLGEAALASWAVLRWGSAGGLGGLILLAVNIVLVSAFWQVISYNAQGTPFQPLWIYLPLIALFAGIAVFLTTQMLAYQRQ